MHDQVTAEPSRLAADGVGLDDLAIDLLIEEARRLQRRRRRFRTSMAALALAGLAGLGLLVSAGSASPRDPGGQANMGPRYPNGPMATSLPSICTASPSLDPQGPIGSPPSGADSLNWVESTFAARYPSIWGGEAARQVTEASGKVVNVPTYRVTYHADQLEAEVRAIDPEANFVQVPYSEACLKGIQADVLAKVHEAPLATMQVNGVGLGFTKVMVSSSSCAASVKRDLWDWLHGRYGDRVSLDTCVANAHT